MITNTVSLIWGVGIVVPIAANISRTLLIRGVSSTSLLQIHTLTCIICSLVTDLSFALAIIPVTFLQLTCTSSIYDTFGNNYVCRRISGHVITGGVWPCAISSRINYYVITLIRIPIVRALGANSCIRANEVNLRHR